MKKEAYLIFNYIKSTGSGLNTVQSIRERKHVLEFIERNFKLIKGKIDKYYSISNTIVKKKE